VTLAADDATVVHQVGSARRTWRASVLSLAVNDLERALERSGFPYAGSRTALPGIPPPRIERVDERGTAEILVTREDRESSPDLARAVAVFESVARQVSGGELDFLPNVLPVVIARPGPAERVNTWLPERRSLLDEWDDLDRRIGLVPPAARAALRERQDEVGRSYSQGLPAVFVGRCPFTGAPAHHYLDPFGLDGLWWHNSGRYRPRSTGGPETLVGLTGCLRLAPAVEMTRFGVHPGPEVPFVVPSVLRDDEVLGVLAAVKVGDHHGVAITYFAPNGNPLARVGTWGSLRVAVRDVNGRWASAAGADPAPQADFELEPWIAAERLLWVSPTDADRSLRVGLEGCPFVGLSGDRRFALVQSGQVRR
jgi:hypothetical protein